MRYTRPAILTLLLLWIIPAFAQEPDEFHEIRFIRGYTKYAKELGKALPDKSVEQCAEELRAAYAAGENVNGELYAWGIALAGQETDEKAMAVVDALADEPTLQAELLLAIATGDPGRQFAWHGSLTDPLAERATDLLDHPDVFVQAIAEWALSSQVQLDNMRTHPQPIHPRPDTPHWYERWLEVPAARRIPYDQVRQVVVFEQHRRPEDLVANAEAGFRRAEKAADEYVARGVDEEKIAGLRASAEEALTELRGAAGQDLGAARRAWLDVRARIRELVLASPDLDFEQLVVNQRYVSHNRANITQSHHPFHCKPGGDIVVKDWRDFKDAGRSLIEGRMGPGYVHSMDMWFEADRVCFAWVTTPDELLEPDEYENNRFTNRMRYYLGRLGTNRHHIYEVNLDGTGLRQITPDHPVANDVEPCYLADGGIMFASQRTYINSACSNAAQLVTNIHRINADGTGLKAYGANKDYDRYCHSLPDGRVLYLHWEYQERHYKPAHTLWSIRPDGTGADAVFNQHLNNPNAFRSARPIGDTGKLVGTATGHYWNEEGAIAILNAHEAINSPEAVHYLATGLSFSGPGDVVPEGGVPERGGYYLDPYPLSERSFLTVFTYNRPLHMDRSKAKDYGVYYIDVWGNKELIHRDPIFASRFPHPVKARPVPPVLPDTTDPERTDAVCYVADVYDGMPEVERGEVKYLRIAHRPGWPGVLPGDPADVPKRNVKAFAGNATGYSFGYWSWSPARVIGEVPVAEDGSAYFRVPVNMPIYFQALDEKHMEVRRMRSSAFFQPGEYRGCIGCHARTNRTAIPHTGEMGKAARGAPDTPTPPPFGDTVFLDFEKHVQPIFDRNCVRCHGGEEPKGKLDLSRSKRVDGFLQSYRSLFGLKADEPTPAQNRFFMDEYQAIGYSDEDRAWKAGKKALSDMARGTYPGMLVSVSDKRSDGGVTEPYAFGSHKSKLITHLLEDPEHRKKVKMSEDDWLTLVTWVDANAPYHGTLLNCESGIEPINVRLAPPFAPQNTITMWEYPDEGSEQ